MKFSSRVVKFPHNAGHCSQCDRVRTCLGRGLEAEEIEASLDMSATPRLLKRGQHLFREGDTLTHLYAVCSGAIKTYKVLPTGEEQILDFFLPGGLIGFDAVADDMHGCQAVALDTTSVCAISYETLADTFRRSLNTQKAFLKMVSSAIARDQRLLVTLGSKAANQRVTSFLVYLSNYYQGRGFSPTRFSLPMSRTDIASYLSLAVETVSRTFTRLQRDGVIALRRNEVLIRDLARLQSIAMEPSKGVYDSGTG